MAICLRGAAVPTARSAAQGLGKGIAGSLGIRGRDLSSFGALSVPTALYLPSRLSGEVGRRSLSTAGFSDQEQASGETAVEELRTPRQDARVSGTAIAGFLGSGKTTFLNPILHGLLHGSRCWASEYPYHIRPGMVFPHGFKGLSSLSDQFSDEESSDEEGAVLRMDKVAIDEDELAIASLGVSNAIVEALAKRGITQLFPIQRAVLEPAMKGRDLIARAKTGTGKTLAFGIPIIRHLVEEDEQSRRSGQFGRPPRALVLAPTRELAKQVEKEFMESAPMLSTICVYGGVSIQMQQRQLQSGVDIAVGTPGRIIDLIERGLLQLQNVHFLVLDEADQMLAVGFEEDVERILEQLPAKRQGMLFSATMPKWVKQLSRKYLNNPLTIDLVGDSNQKLAEGIRNLAISIPASAKRSILSDLITVHGKGGKAIVFTQTKRDADEVAAAMGNLVSCGALHGDITQMQREKTLNAFRDGRIFVLVATDVAARGLDVPNVDLIIHYEIPNDSETFVHRSGRTGRAGKTGTNILMYSDQQIRTMRTIERDVGCKFEQIGSPHVKEVMRASSEQVTHAIKVVNPNLANEFLATAETLLKQQGTNAFAAALAHMSGFSQLPPSRSLLSHEPGMTTVQLTRTGGHSAQPLSARVVNGLLSSISRRAADKVGKICIIDDPKVEGAVFDVPEDLAKELVTKQGNPGDVFELVQKLPKLHVDEGRVRSGDMFGRFSQEGGRSNTQGGSFDRGSRDGNRGDRFGKFSSTRSSDRFGKFSSGGSSDRGDRGRTFSGTCHVCNQPGHRASDCPSGRNRGGGGWGR